MAPIFDSPVGKTGLKWGDVVWSVDQNTVEAQHHDDLEKALSALSSGEHTLYTISAGAWHKAQNQYDSSSGEPFNPQRTAMKINTP